MKHIIVLLFLYFGGLVAFAQQTVPFQLTKEVFKPVKDSLVSFPVFGKVDLGGDFGVFRNMEFWVYDRQGKVVYYASHGIPVSEAFADYIIKMMDKGYIKQMTNHGIMLYRKEKSR